MAEENGVSAMEYAILAGLIAVVSVGAIQGSGTEIEKVFSGVETCLKDLANC